MTPWERFCWWWSDHWIGVLLWLFILAVIAFCVLGVIASAKAKKEFMADCLKERKQYECTAMWRQGDQNVVPIPIVIPVR